MEEGKPSTVLLHLVAVPFPGRGHINPMLSLCRRLSARDPRLLVTFVVTDEWLGLLSSHASPGNVRFKTTPNVVPSEATRGSNYEAFIAAVMFRMGPAVGELVEGLDVPADAVLADALLSWAPEIGARRGIPVAALFPQSATTFFDLQRFSGLQGNGQETAQLNYLPRRSSSHLPEFSGRVDTLRLFNEAISWSTKSHSLLLTSSSALEPLAVDALRSALSVPVLAVGPTVSVDLIPSNGTAPSACSAWLDARPPCSVLYVSLGSFLPILPPQMDEIVAGLRTSGVTFLLVTREHTADDQESSGGGGESLVVPWVDQVRTLSHPSVGGFLTHCGWNSAMEGVVTGVPMLVFPLMWDQFPNARLVVDEWKVGRRLKGEEGDGLVGREEIAGVVKEFMDFGSEEGKGMVRRVKEMKERCRSALEEGGSSLDCMRGFVEGLMNKSEK